MSALSGTELVSSGFFGNLRDVAKKDRIGRAIFGIALPAIFLLAANPVGSIIHMSIIGQLDSVDLKAVKASNAGYNLAVNILMFALASVTASFVTKEKAHATTCADRTSGSVELSRGGDSITDGEGVPAEDFRMERQNLPSASTALAVACFLGLLLMLAAIFGADTFLIFTGVKSDPTNLKSAASYLKLRSLGAPANLLSAAAQGAFVGFRDTRTPLCAIVAGELANIALHVVLVFGCHFGVSGAAIACALSQFFIFGILLWKLIKKADLMPPSRRDVQLWDFIKKAFLLSVSGIALTSYSSFVASTAARLGSTSWSAFQISTNFLKASTVIGGGLAVGGQAILAGALAEKDFDQAKAAVSRVLQIGFVVGLMLATINGITLGVIYVPSADFQVRQLLYGILLAAVTQVMNSWACVFHGMYVGASDYSYYAYSMVSISIIGIISLFQLSTSDGLIGIWTALALHTVLRTTAGFGRIGLGTGPWHILKEGHMPWHL